MANDKGASNGFSCRRRYWLASGDCRAHEGYSLFINGSLEQIFTIKFIDSDAILIKK